MTSRRTFLRQMGSAAAVVGAWPGVIDFRFRQAPAVLRTAAGKLTDVKIDEVTFAYEEHRYRTPLKFGGTLTDRVSILNVHCVVSAKNGKSARGFGSMPMGNVWSWPSSELSYDQTLDAMKALAGRVCAGLIQALMVNSPVTSSAGAEPQAIASSTPSKTVARGSAKPSVGTSVVGPLAPAMPAWVPSAP